MTRILQRLLASIVFTAFAHTAMAGCLATPSLKGALADYPGTEAMPRGNNLIQPAGKSIAATGQVVRVRGRVVDRGCKPVVGAVVELWQTNTDGAYVVASRAALANPYAVFAGAGRATTNNAGEFEFTTLFPGVEGPNRAPHVHVRVRAAGLPTLTTMLYFDNDQRNDQEPELIALDATQKSLLNMPVQPAPDGTLHVSAQIALDGNVAFKRY